MTDIVTPADRNVAAEPIPFVGRGDSGVARTMRSRRRIVLMLNGVTVGLLAFAMAVVLAHDGLSVTEAIMWLAYLATLPWLSIGFWNAVIGTALAARGPVAGDPLDLADPGGTVTTKTALVMTVRNEDPAEAIARVRLLFEDLDAAGLGAWFDVHVLSDTDRPAIAAAEAALIKAWRFQSRRARQIHYRRRVDNVGYKAGNIEEFCERCSEAYDFFLPLDADSMMAAGLVARLVRTMQRHASVGILQTLAVGTPATSPFTRAFQFGMRHGMRSYTMGSVWWQGDCGPYWGHNALIRMAPFAKHCRLPVLPGEGPLGGHVMSHDQVEAVLMRRAGYQVRVLPVECESWEENPPTLPDFVRRELRWCRGNMQYLRLLSMPGLKPVSRVQLTLAILMYAAAPAWMAFLVLGAAAMAGGTGGVPIVWGWVLIAAVLTLCFAPKVLGLASVLASRRESARYGGRTWALAGGLVETLASMLMAPVVAFAVAVFALGLAFGRTIDWRAQSRAARSVSWGEAVRSFWPQTVFGALLSITLATVAPTILWLAAPVLLGLLLAVPFAVLTAHERLGSAMTRWGLCAIPEESATPDVLRRLADVRAGGEAGAPSAIDAAA